MFCFPHLLFGGDTTWTNPEVTDLKHLDEKVTKQLNSSQHLKSVILLAYVRDSQHGITAKQGFQTTKAQIQRESEKTRTSPLQVIRGIKFCGKVLVPLRGHEGT